PALLLRTPFLGNIWHVGNTFSCPLLVLLPVLAGCGFHTAIAGAGKPGWWWRFAAAALLAAVLAMGFFFSSRGQPKSPFFQGYAAALGVAVVALALGLRWTARTGELSALRVALILGLPVLLWRHGQYLRSTFSHYAFVPGQRVTLRSASPAVALVNQQPTPAPVRVIGLQNNLFPVYNVALLWEGLYGVDAVRSGYYTNVADAFHLGRVGSWSDGTPEESAPALRPAHDLLGVKYYLTDHHQPAHEIPGLQLVGQRDLDVYVSQTAWPRAFYTDRLAVYPQDREFAALTLAGDGRPFAAVQDDEKYVPALPSNLAGRTVRAATGYHLTSNTTTFVIDAPGAGIAVLMETFYPEDFEVAMDGRPVSYFRVDHAFKGVAIDRAGRHEITFAYRPQHFTLSLVLAGSGAVLLVGGAFWLWRAGGKKSSIHLPVAA
ncbi:MAG: hypothetical protein ABUL68_05165, partial [Pseudomonadota bacterium]